MSKIVKSSVTELSLDSVTACYLSIQMDISWKKRSLWLFLSLKLKMETNNGS